MHQSDAPKKQSARPQKPRRTRRPAAAATSGLGTPAVPPPAEEEIRLRAYQFYLERRGAPGDPMADWIRAERDLIAEAANTRV
jgi:hypothetical protein